MSILKRIVQFAMIAATPVVGGCTTTSSEVDRVADVPNATPVVVATDRGRVSGLTSVRGTVFLGIPFAAAPVGRLRFTPPTPPPAWDDVRPAIKPGASCPQSSGPDRSEDCLNLNVFAPHEVAAGRKLPVMVWLYGGALVVGSNREIDASILAERQHVLVVVPNYRVGALGFMAHPALRGKGEGNYGILDQQAALQWVQRNIAAFGGDPRNVTLFGESAGALSACTQMVLPGGRGLFARVILQSFTCAFPGQSTTRADAERGGVEMARKLGCADDETAGACLRRLPVDELVKADSRRWGNGGENSWSPMVGGDVLPHTQRDVFERGQAANVPLIMGSNHDEGRLFANVLALTLAFTSDQRYEKALHRVFRPEQVPAVLSEYRTVATRSRYEATADSITDSHFACPMLTLHRLRNGSTPDFVYEFDDPNAPVAIPTVPFTPAQGAFHFAEVPYIFHHKVMAADPKTWTASQRLLADRMQDHWGAFARTGNPDIPGSKWPAFKGGGPLILSPLTNGLAMDFAQRHHCAFWQSQGY